MWRRAPWTTWPTGRPWPPMRSSRGRARAPPSSRRAAFATSWRSPGQKRPSLYDLLARKPAPLVPRHLRFEVAERVLADGRVRAPSTRRRWSACSTTSRRRPRGTRRGARHLLPVRLPRSRARAAGARSRPAAAARGRRRGLARGPRGVPRVRAPQHHRRQRVPHAADERLCTAFAGASRSSASRRALHQPVERRDHVRGARRCSCPCAPRCRGRARASSAPPGSRVRRGFDAIDHLRHGRHEHRRGARPRRRGRVDFEREIGGFPVRVPTLDIHTVGAGGGSIAWRDSGGALKVGPQSAGADPGPACYGRGGDAAHRHRRQSRARPPRPDRDCSAARMPLDRTRARGRRSRRSRSALGLSVLETARGIVARRQRQDGRRGAPRDRERGRGSAGASRSCRSAARGRCTPASSRASWASARSAVPPGPASCARSACSSRTCAPTPSART